MLVCILHAHACYYILCQLSNLIRFLLRAKLQRRAIFNETRSALYFVGPHRMTLFAMVQCRLRDDTRLGLRDTAPT